MPHAISEDKIDIAWQSQAGNTEPVEQEHAPQRPADSQKTE
jgi:hypothetical protein